MIGYRIASSTSLNFECFSEGIVMESLVERVSRHDLLFEKSWHFCAIPFHFQIQQVREQIRKMKFEFSRMKNFSRNASSNSE